MLRRTLIVIIPALVMSLVGIGQAAMAAPSEADVKASLAEFERASPAIKSIMKNAYGYAVFPTVGKGAIGIGGAHGEGLVYEQGKLIGSTTLSQITIGFQLGGQAYRELICFQSKETLEDFKGGNFEFDAQASAVAVTAGISRDATYNHGVAIYTLAKGGFMYEASIGGQKFSFTPK